MLSIETEQVEWKDTGLRETTETSITIVGVPASARSVDDGDAATFVR